MSLTRPYEYPLKGLCYLIVHRSLWRRVLLSVLISILMSLSSYILLFVFAFPNQSRFLSVYMSNWLSWLIGFLLTLYEIQICLMLINITIISCLMATLFDRIWNKQIVNLNDMNNDQSLRTTSGSCVKTFVMLLLIRVLIMILTYPLNIIPIIGTIVFIYLNSYYYGWSLHIRYFDRIDLTYNQGKHYVEQHRSSYLKFGSVSLLFDLIPLLNFLSPITNVIGSALWACDIEKYEDATTHPRSYLISPSQNLIEPQQTDYGSIQNEKQSIDDPPKYEQVVSPSAPPPPPSSSSLLLLEKQ